MKYTYGIWIALFLISLMTAGFLPAIVIGALAVGSSITTGASVADKLEGGTKRRELY